MKTYLEQLEQLEQLELDIAKKDKQQRVHKPLVGHLDIIRQLK